jgi:hypothetical protein
MCGASYWQKNTGRSYNINGVRLLAVLEHNDLGVVVSGNLTWANHISKQVRKANSRMYILHQCFTKSNLPLMSKLFKIFDRPILEFAHPVWFPDRLQDLVVYERVQLGSRDGVLDTDDLAVAVDQEQ